MSKYGNRKTEVDGILFDSKAEARRYNELKIMERCGLIHGLTLQPPFVVVDGKKWSDGRKHRDTVYRADFQYFDETGNIVVEDVKGFRTEAYRIKRELMKERYNIEIREVRR